ncbi:unnamed protein product, partial [Meganyctiphanes norvegica]
MINYRISLPNKMGVKIFYPRRRGLILKILAFCTFLGFVCLWFKSDNIEGDPDIDTRENPIHGINSINKHKDLNKEIAEPNLKNQIIKIDNIEEHKPVLELNPVDPQEVRIAKPEVDVAQNPVVRPRIPSNDDVMERLKAQKLFAEDEKKIVPGLGEMGKPVRMTGEEGVLADEIMKKEAFNLLASDKIALNRSIPDSRDSLSFTIPRIHLD